MQKYKWLDEKKPDQGNITQFSEKLGISETLAGILLSRGMDNHERAYEYLNPDTGRLCDPYLMKDMEEAVGTILSAVAERKRIVIYGDYDVDGITSTAIIYNYLGGMGADVDYYIPDRLDEGYGLSMGAVQKLAERNIELVITVDCGVTAFPEIEYLKQKGIKVVVTDHHECMTELPCADAVVNPCRQDCTYPGKELSGAGVALKLVYAMGQRLGQKDAGLQFMDLAAIGTIADVVPLINENRIIAYYGLKLLNRTGNTGIKALLKAAGFKEQSITVHTVSFVISPRLNAAGRMGDASRSVKLLVSKDEAFCDELSLELCAENKQRQDIEGKIISEVNDMLLNNPGLLQNRVIVLAKEGWHNGIIGIVASRTAERYHKPSILVSLDKDTGKGSGRSIHGFNLYEAISSASGLLDRYGGHELAAGITIKKSNIDKFREAVNQYAGMASGKREPPPVLYTDIVTDGNVINIKLISELERMAPFGTGNPVPVFVMKNVQVTEFKTVGDNKHLRFKIFNGCRDFGSIAFGMGSLLEAFSLYNRMDIAFTPEINTWNSIERIQLNIKDIKAGGEVGILSEKLDSFEEEYEAWKAKELQDENNDLLNTPENVMLEDIVPVRNELAAVYKHFYQEQNELHHIESYELCATRICSKWKVGINSFKLRRCLDIFEELGIARVSNTGRNWSSFTMIKDNSRKVDLDSSITYRRLKGLLVNRA